MPDPSLTPPPHGGHPSPAEIAAEVALAVPPPPSATTLDQIEAWLREARPAVAFVPLGLVLSCAVGRRDELVVRYAADMRAGVQFPPIRLAGATTPFLRRDGSHRIAAARIVGAKTILARIDYAVASVELPFHAGLRDTELRTRCGSGTRGLPWRQPEPCDARPIWLAAPIDDAPHLQPHGRLGGPLVAYCESCFAIATADGRVFVPEQLAT